ncbi:MAG: queuosine precursor transporter [Dehalococcoidia bacterium]|nr:queuosine precursor transporter [Dehalococcoidia bacterium]MCA9843729.1 queuosine precursor transporter [Dehalococcoidia bacterium]
MAAEPGTGHARTTEYRFLVLIASLFTGTLVISNVVAVKISDFGGHYLDSGNIVFPVSYILGDVLTEVYGYRQARKIIWSAFLANALAVGVIVAAGELPAAPFWTDQESYDAILGQTWRIVGASFVAFLVGEFANSAVLARMKVATKGRFLWMRTIGSTLVGQALDSVLFVSIAFAGTGVPELHVLIWETWAFKVAFEVIATPITYIVVGWLKRAEGVDAYDEDVSLNPVLVWQ